MRFTSNQLTEYNELGYVIVDCPFPQSLTNACLEAVEIVGEEPSPEEDGKLNHHRLRPQMPNSYWSKLDHALPFLQIELHAEIVELIRQIENNDDIYFRNGGINELAPDRSFLWHRDTDWEYTEVMHYFSGSTKENGCLRVIPGSHIGPSEPFIKQTDELRQKRGDKNPQTGQSIPDVKLPNEISLELEPHQLLVRSSRIYHATWVNKTEQSRLMHHWLFRQSNEANHRFHFEECLTPELIAQLTPEQQHVLWLNREFDIDPKYAKEQERENGKVFWSVV
ncbi:MAG: hypothetical protein HN521_15975 [Candidatus Latescibacteria bacterium]|jgi:ectoine hydroxylase-related dioxygenase (phytanoyl-CoA dioxygenase family)|nr:hypothetical protein [Candidatus Latescibacterota bacterium]